MSDLTTGDAFSGAIIVVSDVSMQACLFLLCGVQSIPCVVVLGVLTRGESINMFDGRKLAETTTIFNPLMLRSRFPVREFDGLR